MRELGGYIEFEHYGGKALHAEGKALNCGRNCLAYLLEARGIGSIALPYFNCDTIAALCRKRGLKIRYYHSEQNFLPENLELEGDEWIYVVNYYGQVTSEEIKELKSRYQRLIIDNAQAYFAEPIPGVDTIYTCRKFFGVADGAFLFTDANLDRELPQDESYRRMEFLLGRFERAASEFYDKYASNNEYFDNEPVKRMSKLTKNLLKGFDYAEIRTRREKNFIFLHDKLGGINELSPRFNPGPFAYPLLLFNGREIRKQLQAKKIYIPTLWPDVFDICKPEDREYDLAVNVLPLPIDQRYGERDMQYLVESVAELL